MRVATPFVLVAQHDRSFVRPVEVSHVLDVMERVNTNTQCTSSGRVNYVGFPTTTTLSHETYVASKYGLAVEPVTFPVRDAKVTGSNPVGGEYDTRPSTLRLLPLGAVLRQHARRVHSMVPVPGVRTGAVHKLTTRRFHRRTP
jgi:hypothetical protein